MAKQPWENDAVVSAKPVVVPYDPSRAVRNNENVSQTSMRDNVQVPNVQASTTNTQANTENTQVKTQLSELELKSALEARARGVVVQDQATQELRNQLAAVRNARGYVNPYSTGALGDLIGMRDNANGQGGYGLSDLPLVGGAVYGGSDRAGLIGSLGTVRDAAKFNMIQTLKERGAAQGGTASTGLGATSLPEFEALGRVNFNLENDALSAGPDFVTGELSKAEETLLRRYAALSLPTDVLMQASPEQRKQLLEESYKRAREELGIGAVGGNNTRGGGNSGLPVIGGIATGETKRVNDPAFEGLNAEVSAMVRAGARGEDIAALLRDRGRSPSATELAQIQQSLDYYAPYVGKPLPAGVPEPQVDAEWRDVPTSTSERVAGILADNAGGAYAIGAANGLTLGGLDEIVGATSGMSTAEADALKRYMSENYPISTFLGNLTGGVAGMVPVVRGTTAATTALGLGARGTRAAQVGVNALAGATAGALEANQDRGTGAVVGGALGLGGDVLGNYLGGKLAPRLFNAPTGAEGAVADAVTNPQAAAGILSDAERLGSPLAMADSDPGLRSLAGSSVRNSTDALATAEANIGGRDAAAVRRGVLAVDQNLGTETDVVKAAKQIRSDAGAAADPYYKAAYAQPAPVGDKALSDALSTPTAREGLVYARKIAGDEGRKFGITSSNGRVTLGKSATFQDLDYLKRGMDDYIRENFTNDAGQFISSDSSRAAVKARDAVTARMRDLNPDYVTALDTVAGPYAAAQQLEFGGKAVFSTKVNAKQISEAVAGLSPEALDQYRIGAANAIIDKLKKPDPGVDTWKMLRSPDMQERLRAIFPGVNVDNVNSLEAMESLMRRTRNELLSGSPTAPRAAADAAFGARAGNGGVLSTAAEAGAAVATGGVSLLPKLVQAGLLGFKNANKLQSVADQEALGRDLAPILLETDPAKAKKMLQGILDKVDTYNKNSGRLRTATGTAGAVATRPILAE